MATRAADVFQPLARSRRPALTVIDGGPVESGGRYGEDRGHRWPMMCGIACMHVAVGALLLTTGTIVIPKIDKPVMVQMLRDEAPPSPPEQPDIPLEPVKVEIFVPPVEIDVPVLRPSPVVFTTTPPPPVPSAAPPSVSANPGPPVAAPIIPPDGFADQLDNPSPRYPAMSKRNHEQGTVIVRVHVTADGVPDEMSVGTSSGFPRLDQAALETLRRWKFLPAKQAGKPVAAWVRVPITFRPS